MLEPSEMMFCHVYTAYTQEVEPSSKMTELSVIDRSNLVVQKRKELRIWHLEWVGQSPDYNLIEVLSPSLK